MNSQDGFNSYVPDNHPCAVQAWSRNVHAELSVHAQFCEQLRQPLCLALLRNCTSVFDEAYSAATRLFTAILLRPKLR